MKLAKRQCTAAGLVAALLAAGSPLPSTGRPAARAACRAFQTSSIASAPTRPYSRGRGGISDVSTSSYVNFGSPAEYVAIVVLSHLAVLASKRSHQASAW